MAGAGRDETPRFEPESEFGSESESDPETAAVTGATGFLGSHLCERLLGDGYRVRGLSRPTANRGDLAGPVDWVVGDLFAEDRLRALVDGADVVFHLAGVSLWNADDETVFRVNVEGTRTLLDACKSCDVDRVVFTSTAGTRRPHTTGHVADESDVVEPIGAYQASKAEAEALVDAYVEAGGDAITTHPTSIFGPGDGSFTTELLAMAVEPTRFAYLPGGVNVVGVEDVAGGLVAAAERGTAGEHYILGGENVTYEDAVRRIAAVAGDGSYPARVRVPARAIHAAGPVAEMVSRVTGRRMFPFDRQMARLATQQLFYTSRKAHEELGYTYEPIESHVPAVLEWYRSR